MKNTTPAKDPVVAVPSEVYVAVKDESARTGIKIRAIVKQALEAWLKARKGKR